MVGIPTQLVRRDKLVKIVLRKKIMCPVKRGRFTKDVSVRVLESLVKEASYFDKEHNDDQCSVIIQ